MDVPRYTTVTKIAYVNFSEFWGIRRKRTGSVGNQYWNYNHTNITKTHNQYEMNYDRKQNYYVNDNNYINT